MVKIVKNGRPDFKRARLTGLSARRARRRKSRGPKGLQLEVGGQRLLVETYVQDSKSRVAVYKKFICFS